MTMITLPEEFVARMKGLLGGDYPAFSAALREGDATKALFSGCKLTEDEFTSAADFPLMPLPYGRGGYMFSLEHPGRHPLHHAGAFYVQDPSAQATVSALSLPAGARVLDCCAAPGGKSIQLGCAAGENGLLVSNEINPSRARILASNIERMGLTNTVVTSVPTDILGRWYSGYFDLVVADAPCSGEGMFRKYPEALSGWNPGMVRKCAALQKEILDNVCGCVKPGGYLLYSTCTFSVEENEEQVAAFLSRHGDFTLRPVGDALTAVTAPAVDGLPHARRFYPHLSPGEGQFIALMQRSAECAPQRTPRDERIPPRPDELETLNKFLRENTDIDPAGISVCSSRDGLRTLSCDHPHAGKGVFAYGVLLGTAEKGVFRPHHQFFSAYGHRFLRKLALTSADADTGAFLAGNTVKADIPDGWCTVTVDGAPLAGGKAVGGTVKNHYPKGLRAK